MPKLVTDEGALDEAAVEREFARAMAEPPADEPTAPAPARKAAAEAPRASHSPQEPADDPKHDKPRRASASAASGEHKRGRGRPRKEQTPPSPAEGAYVAPVAEFLQSLTIVGALAPIPDGALQVRVRLQAALVNQHAPGLASAVDSAARHNEVIRKGVEALTMGSAGWVLPAVLAVAPFAAQSLGLWRAPVDEGMAAAAESFAGEVKAALQAQGDGEQAAA